jgi:hypothetical protein
VLLNDGYVYRETLGSHPGKSALTYLAGKYQHSSEAEWRARFLRGEVLLDGVIASGAEPIRAGQLPREGVLGRVSKNLSDTISSRIARPPSPAWGARHRKSA